MPFNWRQFSNKEQAKKLAAAIKTNLATQTKPYEIELIFFSVAVAEYAKDLLRQDGHAASIELRKPHATEPSETLRIPVIKITERTVVYLEPLSLNNPEREPLIKKRSNATLRQSLKVTSVLQVKTNRAILPKLF